MKNMKINVLFDTKGLACLLLIVKTKKAIEDLEIGQILEVHTPDKWAKGLNRWTRAFRS